MNFSAAGEQIPINELDANVVELYVQDMRAKFEQIFLPFKKLCKTLNVSLFFILYLDLALIIDKCWIIIINQSYYR